MRFIGMRNPVRTALSLPVVCAGLLLTGCVDDGEDGRTGPAGDDGAPGSQTIALQQIGRFVHGDFDKAAAEIVAFDAGTDRLFVTNSQDDTIDVLDTSDPTALSKFGTLDLSNGGAFTDIGGPNSVAVHDGLVAVAVENDDKQANGWIFFFNASDRSFSKRVEVGPLPDMVAFSPDGSYAVCANEGEPNDDYSEDPEGSVGIIAITGGTPEDTSTLATFTAFNVGGARAADFPPGGKIFGNLGHTVLTPTAVDNAADAVLDLDDTSALAVGDWVTIKNTVIDGDGLPYRVTAITADTDITLNDSLDDEEIWDGTGDPGDLQIHAHDGESTRAQDLEPEYVAIASDNDTAYVSCQENNVVAVVDLSDATVTAIVDLGYKDHSILGNELDAADKDDAVNIVNWPLKGLYMPDTIATYEVAGSTYLVSANEGDGREYDGFNELLSFEDAEVDPGIAADTTPFTDDEKAAEIETTLWGDTDGDGDLDEGYVYGSRSFAIWDADGRLLFDSGSQMELITAQRFGINFNNDNDELDPDGKSDAAGPEPEALAVGQVGNAWYAFVGSEDMGGIFVYDITQPHSPDFVQYLNNRDLTFTTDPEDDADGDYGPEGFTFVSAADSPTGVPLLVVASEVSGSTTVYAITTVPADATASDTAQLPTPEAVNSPFSDS